MTITQTIYQTADLLDVIRTVHRPTAFWLDKFFPNVRTSNSENIMFDDFDSGRRIAPFVAPNVQGRPMKEKGYSTRVFTPAYVKPKTPVTPDRTLTRRAGEMYGGELSPAQRRDAIIADITVEQRNMIERRWEWMAAQAIINGSVVVAGDDYPEVTVDFGRDASQTITLTGGALWSAGTSTPLEDIDDWCDQTWKLPNSSNIQNLVFGVDAWRSFAAHADVQQALDTRRGSQWATETVNGIGNSDDPFVFKGRMPNGSALWVYNDVYEDDLGANQPMMDSTYVVGVGNVQGVRAFGAIMDARAGYQSLPIFPKMWVNEDPSVEFIMSQSAPLMIPGRPNATFRAKVV